MTSMSGFTSIGAATDIRKRWSPSWWVNDSDRQIGAAAAVRSLILPRLMLPYACAAKRRALPRWIGSAVNRGSAAKADRGANVRFTPAWAGAGAACAAGVNDCHRPIEDRERAASRRVTGHVASL